MAGGSGHDLANRMVVDGAGNAYAVGFLESAGSASMGTRTLTLAGNQHLFVWRFPLGWL